MSSSISEDSIHEAKLLVHIAENGRSFEVECKGTTSTDTIMQFVCSVSGIDTADQLVLSSGMKLEPQRPLSAYKLPSDDKEVFIFNKARLQSNAPPPPHEQVDFLEIKNPPFPSSSHKPHPLDDASDPALKALPSYERQFRYHYHCGNSIFSRSQMRYEACQRLFQEQKVQERALEVARANLEQYYRMINQNFSEFMKRYMMQHRIHSDLLANFGRDIERLRSIKLHPSLQTASRRCLLDLVKEENLRRAMENSRSSHRQFENKVSQFKQMFAEVKRKVEDMLATKTSMLFQNVELMIREHQGHINEERSIMQSLSKDVDMVKKLVDDCLSGHSSSSLRPHDAVSALGPMYDVHEKNHLPRMQACDNSICELLDVCKEKKNEMNVFVHNYMQRIAYISYIIKDARLQFPVFREAMARQDDLFVNLKLVRGIGPAYRACLAEIVRRRASVKLYMGLAGQLAERLAVKREAEVRRREEFLREQSSFIPGDILASMGLYDMPNQCDVNIAPFDTGLLDIDISELDRYAPDYLVGLASKRGNQETQKDLVTLSHGDSDPTDEQIEDLDMVEIAGTSKMEVENAKLKAEYASAIALICSLSPLVDYDSLDDSEVESALKISAEKTAEALHFKDEYGKHLHRMLRAKQMQCDSYERRIQELEQKLSEVYHQEQKPSIIDDGIEFSSAKPFECKLDGLGDGELHMPCAYASDPMDEGSCISNSCDTKSGVFNLQTGKPQGLDGNMMDLSVLGPHHDKVGKNKAVQPLGASTVNSYTAENVHEHALLPCNADSDDGVDSKLASDIVQELQSTLADKLNQLTEIESKLKAAQEEIASLRRELEGNQKLLGESQMNCAHLENCLHEAREEAQTHLCAANRRASEYSVLRASAVRMRTIFERLRACIYSPGGVAGFADSLQALAQSLSQSMSEKEEDGSAEFRKCIQILADRVGFLSRHREELLEKYPKVEAANEQLRKELEEKKELVKVLYTKHQLEKQANKEKISFGQLEVPEIAAFVLNSRGHYIAINRDHQNYYLSAESVALFTDHLPARPSYIVAQVVHIERQLVKPLVWKPDQRDHMASDGEIGKLNKACSGSAANPFDLPVGCEYFVVTVAMVPGSSVLNSSST